MPVDVEVGLLAAKGAEALVVGAAAPPALRVPNAFEKENALPGTAVLDVTVVLDVAGTAAVTAAGTTAGLDTVVVAVVVEMADAVVEIGSVLLFASVTLLGAVANGLVLPNNPFEASIVPPNEKLPADKPPPKMLAGLVVSAK